MSNIIKSIIASAVAGAVVVVVALTAFAPTATVTNNQTVVKGTTPEISSPYLSVNGVVEWFSQVPMASGAATTTICSIQAPTASSSISSVSVRFGGISSSTDTFTIGTSTTITGVAGALASTITAATSSGYYYRGTGIVNLNTGEYINVNLAGLATTTGGYCLARFVQF